ncbi:hypothetical protein TIFTF001_010641 [Ficus carica]|uniref:Folylpolyglutamate synthase n=1 Tax=Ficus carica TaxID=3494 RepID=A0AA87ZWU0_FICCA|nr:hypothetical protein TIFTF001_010641 [Ficus carica]
MTEEDGNGSPKLKPTPYEEAMDALSSLNSERNRPNQDVRFDLLFDYVKVSAAVLDSGLGEVDAADEDHPCRWHKGKGGYYSVEISEEKFVAYFWWCVNRLKEKATEDIPMPPYFRFLALLALVIFAAEQVDVAILEVGIGGKLDPTNVVQAPVVCGISSLGYDHMEILGNTLREIAGDKAGIFKPGVPAFTVSQPDEAMHALQDRASQLDIPLRVVPPLDAHLLNCLRLGLGGEHQYLNAGLAVALCSSWLQRTGHVGITNLEDTNSLPEQFIKGLTTASLHGRAQIIPDRSIDFQSPRDLVFYLDGAHTPESMEVCARWFSLSIKEGSQQVPQHNSLFSHELGNRFLDDRARKKSIQVEYIILDPHAIYILVFNCMSVRDPHALLPCLIETCASHGEYLIKTGVCFKKALFVPNTSLHQKVGSKSLPPSEVDLSWQFTLQKVWENLMQENKGGSDRTTDAVGEDLKVDTDLCVKSGETSVVFCSLPLVIKWLRDTIQQNQSACFQVLVTGSLHLVGDVLRSMNSETSH